VASPAEAAAAQPSSEAAASQLAVAVAGREVELCSHGLCARQHGADVVQAGCPALHLAECITDAALQAELHLLLGVQHLPRLLLLIEQLDLLQLLQQVAVQLASCLGGRSSRPVAVTREAALRRLQERRQLLLRVLRLLLQPRLAAAPAAAQHSCCWSLPRRQAKGLSEQGVRQATAAGVVRCSMCSC
jgi:hypothetical protein